MVHKLAFARIQARDGGFVFIAQRKIKHIQVFRHALGFHRFGEHHNIALHQPADNHLRHGFAVFFADGSKHGVLEDAVFALGKRCPRFHGNAFALQRGNLLVALVERVDFNLVCLRHDLVEYAQIHRTVRGEIAHADGADFACRLIAFQRTPCTVHIAVGLVNQHHVYIA